jgi:hypothetical protein
MMPKIKLPEIPESERTPTVMALLDVISLLIESNNKLSEENQILKNELARLKGNNPKPKIKPSILHSEPKSSDANKRKKRKKKREKQAKKVVEIPLKAEDLPPGSEFRGYKDFRVENIELTPVLEIYRREKWRTPDGRFIIAPLPERIDSHFGAELKSLILSLNYSMNVPQSHILNFLTELGVDISAGQIQNILSEGYEDLHTEKDLLLEHALQIFPYIATDDTGARHKGKNSFCNYIGNEFFAHFKTTESKSRINFLKILRGNRTDFVFTEESIAYMAGQGLSKAIISRVEGKLNKNIPDESEWNSFLWLIGVKSDKEIKTLTEGALLGSILSYGIRDDLVILSDEAGQFDILIHALCWMHAERKLSSLIPINDYHKTIIDKIRGNVWDFYQELKAYKIEPDSEKKECINYSFDKLFSQKTEFESINRALELIYKNKKGLLIVLDRPEIPLHNNMGENDIRVFVTKRKIHGGTRSDKGRLCRDTFMSLKKTCRKLGISFYSFLYDRISKTGDIPPLYEIMKLKYCEGS